MRNNTLWIGITIITTLLFCTIFGAIFIFTQIDSKSLDFSERIFESSSSNLEEMINRGGPAREGYFSRFSKDLIRQAPNLLAIHLYSLDKGTIYLKAVSSSYVENPLSEHKEGLYRANLTKKSEDTFVLSTPIFINMGSPLQFEVMFAKTLTPNQGKQINILILLGMGAFVFSLIFLIFARSSVGEKKAANTTSVQNIPVEMPQKTSSDLVDSPPVVTPTETTLEASHSVKAPAPTKQSPPVPMKPSASPQEQIETESIDITTLYTESGLVWEHLLKEKLDEELKRSASFDQDLSLAIINCEITEGKTELIKQLQKTFRYKDLMFESSKSCAAIIVPNCDLELASSRFEDFQEKHLKETMPDNQLHIGISSRNGRLLSGDRLIKEADSAYKKAMEDEGSSIILFRVDPKKFRQVVSEKTYN